MKDKIYEIISEHTNYIRQANTFEDLRVATETTASKLEDLFALYDVVNSDSDVCPDTHMCKIIKLNTDSDICQKCGIVFKGKWLATASVWQVSHTRTFDINHRS